MLLTFASTVSFILMSFLASAQSDPKAFCELKNNFDDSVYSISSECNESGVIQKRTFRFKKNNGIGRIETFSKGKLSHLLLINMEGVTTAEFYIRHVGNDTFLKTQVNPGTNTVIAQSEFKGPAEYEVNEPTETKRWYVRNGNLAEINILDLEGEVTERIFLDEHGGIKESALFSYRQAPGSFVKYIQKMEIVDSTGARKGIFEKNGNLDIPAILRSQAKSETEAKNNIEKFQTQREPFLIIDTGFDISHPDLTRKMFNNSIEKLDRVDNDANRWVDDTFGWDVGTNTNDIRDNVLRPANGMPYSHGTHVASIALKKVEKFGLMGLAGNMAHLGLILQAQRYMETYKIRFVNMSFGWEETRGASSPFVPGSEVSNGLEKLIEKSKNTLFVVAAGNESSELTYDGYCSLPACFRKNNLLRVGALNVSGYSKEEIENSTVADFSNFGKDIVDIFAPGENVLAAGIGNQQVSFSGTSMASPNTLNILLRMSEKASHVEAQKLKEILLKTAYIPNINSPMACKSGGKVFPARALAVLAEYVKNPRASVDSIVFKIRKQGIVLTGEDTTASTEEKLIQIWTSL